MKIQQNWMAALQVVAIPGAFLLYQAVVMANREIELMSERSLINARIVLFYLVSVALVYAYTRLIDLCIRLSLAGVVDCSLFPKIRPLIFPWVVGGFSQIAFVFAYRLLDLSSYLHGKLLLLSACTLIVTFVCWMFVYQFRYAILILRAIVSR